MLLRAVLLSSLYRMFISLHSSPERNFLFRETNLVFLQRNRLTEALIHCQAAPDPYPFIHVKYQLTYSNPKQEVVLLRVQCLSQAAPLRSYIFMSLIFYTATLKFLTSCSLDSNIYNVDSNICNVSLF